MNRTKIAARAKKRLLKKQRREERLERLKKEELQRAKRLARQLPKPAPKKKKKSRKKNRRRVDYYKYINSKEWKRKRKKVLRYYKNRCSICKKTWNLQVHHKHYRSLGREKFRDLQVLCSGCHANVHEGKIVGCYDPITLEYLLIMRTVN